jgi:hypothetical protein
VSFSLYITILEEDLPTPPAPKKDVRVSPSLLPT